MARLRVELQRTLDATGDPVQIAQPGWGVEPSVTWVEVEQRNNPEHLARMRADALRFAQTPLRDRGPRPGSDD